MGRGRADDDERCRPVRRGRRLVVEPGGEHGRARRRAPPGHRVDRLRQLRLRRLPRRVRPGRAVGGRRTTRRAGLAHHRDPRPRPRRGRRQGGRRSRRAGRRPLRRRRARRRTLDERGRRRRRPDRVRRPREGRARPRPPRHRRRADRRALAAAAPGGVVPDVLELPRRRAVRRDPRDARAPRAWPGHLTGAGRHDPPHRRRRARPGPGRDPGPLVEGPRGSTSTPCGRSPTRWSRTARR